MSDLSILPAGVALTNADQRRMSPQWYQWMVELISRVNAHDAATILAGLPLTSQVLVAGNNTIAHGLGREPNGWFSTSFRGAFASSAGGGGTIYLPHQKTRFSKEDWPSAARTSVSHTMAFTPANGSTLILVFGASGTTPTAVSSITQTGVTWTKVNSRLSSAFTTGSLEMWIGTAVSSAGTGVTIAFSSMTSLLALTISEFTDLSGTVTASAVGDETSGGASDTGVDGNLILTAPTASAGDVQLAAVWHTISSIEPGPTNGWDLQAWRREDSGSGSSPQVMLFSRVAHRSEAYPLVHTFSGSANKILIQAAVGASLTSVGGGSVTIPHGLREVSKDATNLVLNSVSAVTADLWVF